MGKQDTSDWSYLGSIIAKAKTESKEKPNESSYDALINKASEDYGVPVARIKAVIKQESGFNPKAVSSAGAQGLMQLMPKTAEGLGVTDPFDPAQNIDGGVRYLKQMYDQFGDWDLSHAAYNAGPGNVIKSGYKIPFNKETPKYVKAINANLGVYGGGSNEANGPSIKFGFSKEAKAIENWDFLKPVIPNKDLATTGKELEQSGIESDQIEKDISSWDNSPLEFLGKEFIEGASFELKENDTITKDPTLKYSGYAAHLAGSLASGVLAGWGLGAIGAALGAGAKAVGVGEGVINALSFGKKATALGKAAQGLKLEQVAAKAVGETPEVIGAISKQLAATRGKALAATAAAAAVEGGVIGGTVEGIKSKAVYNEDLDEVLANIGAGTLGGAILGIGSAPIAMGVGAFVGRKQFGQLTQGVKALAGDASALGAIKKIAEINPTVSVREMVANPKIAKELLDESVKDVATNFFANEGKDLLAQNKALKILVDNKKYAEALDMVNQSAVELIQANPSARELVGMAFFSDAKKLAEIEADALLGKNSKRYLFDPSIRGKLINYKLNPTDEALEELKGIPFKNKTVFGTNKGKRDLEAFVNGSLKFSPRQIDELASNHLNNLFKNISDGKLSSDLLGTYTHTQGMLNALTTSNKALSQGVFEAFNKSQTLDDMLGKALPEDMLIVKKIAGQRMDQEKLNMLMQERLQVLKDLKINPKDKNLINRFQDLRRSTNDLARRIKEVNAGLEYEIANVGGEQKAVIDEQIKRAKATVAEMYLPSAKDLSSKGANADIGKSAVMSRIFNRDNPVYIKNGSDLADMLHSMNITGHDPEWINKISLSHVQKKMTSLFGPNNPFQRAIFDEYKKGQIAIRDSLARYDKEIKALVISAGSKLSAMIQQYGEGRLNPDVLQSLSDKDRQTVINGAEYFKKAYSDLFQEVNAVLARNNFSLVQKRDNYFHHYLDEILTLPERILRELSGETAGEEFKLGGMAPKHQRSRLVAGFERHRTGQEFTDDVVGGFQRYVGQALKIKNLTDIVRVADTAQGFAPSSVSKFLAKFKDQYLLGLAPEGESQFKESIKFAVNEARRRTSQAFLLGNVGTAMQQLFSIPQNFVYGKAGVKAIMNRYTSRAAQLFEQSSNLKLRDIERTGFDKDQALIRKGLRKIGLSSVADMGDRFEQAMGLGLRVFDAEAAKHSFLTGFYKAESMGLSEADAIKFADHFAGLIQGDMSRIGQPEFVNSTLGRAFAQFSSFTMNMFTTIWNDLPLIAKNDGAIEAVRMILKSYATMSLTNSALEQAGMKPQFDLESFFPFLNTARFGVPGLPQILGSSVRSLYAYKNDEITFEDGLKAHTPTAGKDLNTLKSALTGLTGVPGALQVKKTLSYINDEDAQDETDTPVKKGIGYISGSSVKYNLRKARGKVTNRINANMAHKTIRFLGGN